MQRASTTVAVQRRGGGRRGHATHPRGGHDFLRFQGCRRGLPLVLVPVLVRRLRRVPSGGRSRRRSSSSTEYGCRRGGGKQRFHGVCSILIVMLLPISVFFCSCCSGPGGDRETARTRFLFLKGERRFVRRQDDEIVRTCVRGGSNCLCLLLLCIIFVSSRVQYYTI